MEIIEITKNEPLFYIYDKIKNQSFRIGITIYNISDIIF